MKELKNAIAKAISLFSSATNIAQETGVKLYSLTQETRKVGALIHSLPTQELGASGRPSSRKAVKG